MLEAIKEQITLSMAAKQFNVELLPNKSGQRCPACGGSSSLRTKDDRYFKCFKCGAAGSVIDLAILCGQATTVTEAINLFKPLVRNHQYTSYASLKQKVYDIYKQNLNHTAQFYAESRGWDYQSLDCGLATKGCLQAAGLSEITLQQVGLWDGYDYYSNHLIFPIYSESGNLVHYCGRAIGNSEIRWKSSKGTPPITRYFYNSKELYNPSRSYLIVCEGISDCVSLMQLGESVIGQFGVNVDLSRHAEHFSKFDFIVFMYDYDKYPLGSPNAGTYKSWSQMMPEVIKLAMLIHKPLYNLRLPDLPTIKDINDWLLYIDYDKDIYTDYRNKHTAPIAELALEMYGHDLSKHQLLWRLVSATKDSVVAKQLLKSHSDVEQYLFDIFAYE